MGAQDPSAALALVSARPQTTTAATEEKSKAKNAEEDPDLTRAKDLVDLHYSVKVQHANATVDESLLEARRNVESVLRDVT